MALGVCLSAVVAVVSQSNLNGEEPPRLPQYSHALPQLLLSDTSRLTTTDYAVGLSERQYGTPSPGLQVNDLSSG